MILGADTAVPESRPCARQRVLPHERCSGSVSLPPDVGHPFRHRTDQADAADLRPMARPGQDPRSGGCPGKADGLAVAFATGLGWVAITARSVVWPRVAPP